MLWGIKAITGTSGYGIHFFQHVTIAPRLWLFLQTLSCSSACIYERYDNKSSNPIVYFFFYYVAITGEFFFSSSQPTCISYVEKHKVSEWLGGKSTANIRWVSQIANSNSNIKWKVFSIPFLSQLILHRDTFCEPILKTKRSKACMHMVTRGAHYWTLIKMETKTCFMYYCAFLYNVCLCLYLSIPSLWG